MHAIDGINITPNVLDFGIISINKLPIERTIYVHADRWTQSQKEDMKWNSTVPWLVVDANRVERGRQECSYKVRVIGPLSAGRINARLKCSLTGGTTGQDISRNISVVGEVVE